MVTCCWTKEDVACGAKATIHYCIPLCPEHYLIHVDGRGHVLRQAAGVHGVQKFPGLCYILLFDDETVKIGYSNTEKLLQKRFRDLARDARKAGESFEVMAVLAGGCATEAVLHHRFKGDRIQGKGERFRLSEDILDFLATAPRLDIPMAL